MVFQRQFFVKIHIIGYNSYHKRVYYKSFLSVDFTYKNQRICKNVIWTNYLPKLGKKLQLTLYEHEYANFNFFFKIIRVQKLKIQI